MHPPPVLPENLDWSQVEALLQELGQQDLNPEAQLHFDGHHCKAECCEEEPEDDSLPKFSMLHPGGWLDVENNSSFGPTLRGLRGEEPIRFASQFGRVRHGDPSSPIAALSECGDEGCGAHRLHHPQVRKRFRAFITNSLRGSLANHRTSFQYASLGSGRLLWDLELLERCRVEGVRIARICLVDRDYLKPTEEILAALHTFAEWQQAVAKLTEEQPPEILVYRSARAFTQDAREGGPAAGCHLLMHCDAFWPGCDEQCMEAAQHALVPGGMMARLSNLGSREVDSSRVEKGPTVLQEFWREQQKHSAAPFSAIAWVKASDGDLEVVEDPLLGEDPDVKMQRESRASERLRRAEQKRGEELGLEVWKVIQAPFVSVFATPSASSKAIGKVHYQDELVAARRSGNWIRLAGSADLWDVDYQAQLGREEDLAKATEAWVPIHSRCISPEADLGPFLQQVYVPPGREPWDPASAAEEDSTILTVQDGEITLRAGHQSSRQGFWRCGCHCWRARSTTSFPASARRRQQERVRWRSLAMELQDIGSADRRSKLAQLQSKERAGLRNWLQQARRRWQALAQELTRLSQWERRERLAELSMEDRVAFRQYLSEQKKSSKPA